MKIKNIHFVFRDLISRFPKNPWQPRNFIHTKFYPLKLYLCQIISLDNDECQLNTHECHADGICINYNGTYNCTCQTGYSGNGFKCEGNAL